MPRRSGRTLALLTVAVATGGTLLLLELALRVGSGTPFSVPEPGGPVSVVGVYPGTHDVRIGYVPKPGAGGENVWGETVTITADGVRSNGGDAPAAGVPVLAVGDSYTFGDEVSDHETWPAQLEGLLRRPVVNGGVFGYGFDQIVLRAEQLLPKSGADTLVVSFSADDVRRCEYVYRYAWKPWFAVEDGALSLRGVPVPEPRTPPPGEGPLRRALRWSYFADFVMRRLDPSGWPIPDSLRAHRQGVSVARLLVERLASRVEADGLRLLLVVQWHPHAESALAASAVGRAQELGLALLTTEPLLRHEISRHEGGAQAFFQIGERGGRVAVGHMTPLGNSVVARAIASRLARPR